MWKSHSTGIRVVEIPAAVNISFGKKSNTDLTAEILCSDD